MDAKVDSDTLLTINQKLQNCYSKLNDEITTIRNEYSMMNSYFEGEAADKFKEETEDACNSICDVVSALDQLYSFVAKLNNVVGEYDNTKYSG